METQGSDPSNPVPSNKAADEIIEGEYTVIEDRAPQNQTSQPLSVKLPEKEIKPEFDDPDQMVQKLIYGRPLVAKDKNQEPEETQNSEQKPPGKRLEFDSSDVMVQKLVYGRPLVVKKDAVDATVSIPTLPAPETAPTGSTPIEDQTDEEKANQFYDEINKAAESIDDQQNAKNLEIIRSMAGFREIDPIIQSLVLEFSKDDFVSLSSHILTLKSLAEKLAPGLRSNDPQHNKPESIIPIIALALNLEITNRTNTMSREGQESAQGASATPEDPVTAIPQSPGIPPPSPTPGSNTPAETSEVTDQILSETSEVTSEEISEPELPRRIIPKNTSGNQLIKVMDSILEQTNSEALGLELDPNTLASYVKETVKLPNKASFHGTPKAEITKDPNGRIILTVTGSAGGPFGLVGNVEFSVKIGNRNTGGIEVIDQPEIKLSGQAKNYKEMIEEQIKNINQVLLTQTSQRINKNWEAVNFEISSDGPGAIILVCRRKT